MAVFKAQISQRHGDVVTPGQRVVAVLAGPSPDNLRLVGRLTVTADEADELVKVLDGQSVHVVQLREDGFTIRHPLACRTDLFRCLANDVHFRPPEEPGTWELLYSDSHAGWHLGQRIA